jgi:hypothetical protein
MTDKKTDAVRERVARQVRALREKTVENGCTEAEALAAAQKMQALMAEHDLTLTDAEVENESVGLDEVVSKFKVMRPVDLTCSGIAALCGVKIWFQKGSKRRVQILGQKSGTEFAIWLYAMIDGAIVASTSAWQRDPETGWKQMDGQEKKTTCKSFEVGMAHRINRRLTEMAERAQSTAKTSTGTAVMVLRNQVVDAAYTKMTAGWKWGRGSAGPRARDAGAYAKGRAAGDRVNLDRPLGNSATKRIGA